MDPNTQPLQNKSLNDHSNNVAQPSVNDLVSAFEDSMKDDISSPASAVVQKASGMSQKIADLRETDTKIEQKSISLKSLVAGKLESLKDLKNEIGTLIDQIKELEETRTKISEEIAKLTALDVEVSNLEKEANNELN